MRRKWKCSECYGEGRQSFPDWNVCLKVDKNLDVDIQFLIQVDLDVKEMESTQ